MPRDERHRQKSLARKAAKRKEKKHTLARLVLPASERALVRSAAHWSVYECLLSDNWESPGEMVQVLVARRSSEGVIAAALFLVDLGCLGVKNCFARYCPTLGQYEMLREDVRSRQRMIKSDINLAAKIVREGVAYARSLGFSPNRDYVDAATLLADADPDACPTRIPLGLDDQPYFVSGPFDNVRQIMRQLEKAVGPGNFHFLAEVDESFEFAERDYDVLPWNPSGEA